MLLHALDLNPNLFSEIRALEAVATLISSTFKIGRMDSRDGEEIERGSSEAVCCLHACSVAERQTLAFFLYVIAESRSSERKAWFASSHDDIKKHRQTEDRD